MAAPERSLTARDGAGAFVLRRFGALAHGRLAGPQRWSSARDGAAAQTAGADTWPTSGERRCACPRLPARSSSATGRSVSAAGPLVLGRCGRSRPPVRSSSAAGALVLGRRCARPRSRPRPPVHSFSADGQRELIVTPLRWLPVAPARSICLDFKKLHDYPTTTVVIVSMSSVIKAEAVV